MKHITLKEMLEEIVQCILEQKEIKDYYWKDGEREFRRITEIDLLDRIRTSNDDLAFALGYQDGYRTIHSFTANGTDQNITCTVNFAQKNTGNPNANVTAENWVATENEDYTDVYIYFYNQTGEATMTISNISLEAVTTTEE